MNCILIIDFIIINLIVQMCEKHSENLFLIDQPSSNLEVLENLEAFQKRKLETYLNQQPINQ